LIGHYVFNGNNKKGIVMFRLVCITMVCAGLTTAGCTIQDEDSSGTLDTIIIHVDELGPSSFDELIEQSSVIVRTTLDSITERVGHRGGYNEDEPASEFVELIGLNFSIDEILKGESPTQLTILWDGYIVKNIDGQPAERLKRVSLAGTDFASDDIGQSFVLFLAGQGNELDIITVTDGIAHLFTNGTIRPAATSGVLGIDSETATIDSIRNLDPSEHSTNSVGNVGDPGGDTNANDEPGSK
jgi:hypothetical protein